MQNLTLGNILCCKCGTSILSNPTNMCEPCLTSECDITADIPKQLTIVFCPKCERFLNPPSQWVPAALESPELLSICLKRVKGLGKNNKLKEASFIYTEPHSRRLIVQITIRGEIRTNTIVEQKAVLHYTMLPQQCQDCTRHEAKDYWNACVQVRQRVEHKRTLHYLEQLLLRKNAPRKYTSVKSVKGGLDFFFGSRSAAVAFAEYVSRRVPCRSTTSQQLKSHDVHSNTFNYKTTLCLEVAPVCKHDVVCLPRALATGRLGLPGGARVCLVTRLTDRIHLLEPVSCATRDIDAAAYFAAPFTPISTPRNLTDFFVMDIEEVEIGGGKSNAAASCSNLKPVGTWVVPAAHLGSDGEEGDQVYVRTHLGHVLKIGDTVRGLDLRNANINHSEFESIPEDKRPQIVLIQRVCDSSNRRRRRKVHRRRVLSNGKSDMESVTEIASVSGTVDESGDDGDFDSDDYSDDDDEFFDAEEGVDVSGEKMETE